MTKNQGIPARLNLVISEQFGGIPNRLATAARISPGTFSRYLEGASIPGGENLIRIKEATGRSLDWLLTGEDQAVNAEGIIPFQSPEEREYLEKLLEVLRNPNTKRAIQENIDTFLKVPRPEVDPLPEKKKGVVNRS